ncbi:30S ribosomal protein S17 [Candidatus Bipolaricaulota bacterium]|jgi:small subunit ribosomal protein S17|nr:30S ribosomal protein S17 [Candidatus Bipolaricaulota bacterium]TFH11689.1 MAG: 30S ribosomal protein S17 [Candidatus Atribacteria bacterium]
MRKTKTGHVVSDKMTQTIVVRVEERTMHAKYRKHISQHVKFHAHDPLELAGIGDIVKIEECRPMSRLKRWRLIEVLEKAEG